MNKLNYKITNLDCPTCAMKIEKSIRNSSSFSNVNLNFSTQKLSLNSTLSYNDTFIKLKKIISSVEPEAKINKYSENNITTKSKKSKLTLLILSTLLLIIYILFGNLLPYFVTLSLLLATYILSSIDVYIYFITGLLKLNIFNENFLMILASITAFIIHKPIEACSIMMLYSLGEILQNKAINSSRKSIEKILEIQPKKANLKTENEYIEVSPDILKIGDIIMIKPGEKVPVDSLVLSGHTFVNTKYINGESVPISVSKDSKLISGYINIDSTIIAKVTNTFENSAISKMLDLIENSNKSKSNGEKFITKFARIYTPLVITLALIISIVPPLFLYQDPDTWIYRGLIFLVASCPCALVISIPLTYFAGIGFASKKGILIKGSIILENLSKIDKIIFDKTGTLTYGSFTVQNLVSTNSDDELLQCLYLAEYGSNHPIAKSIIEYITKLKKIKIPNINSWKYKEIPGKGIIANKSNDTIIVGSSNLFKDYNISTMITSSPLTTIHIAKNKIYLGYITLGDTIRKDSITTIKKLKELKIKNLVMMSGDKKEITDTIANKLGIDEAYSELSPQDKYNLSKNNKFNTLYVGDGINDTPVMSLVDVSVALSNISQDSVIETSDVVITNNKLESIPNMIKIGRFSKRLILENISFALFIKLSVLILGSLGYSTIIMAIFADVGVTLLSVINSLRILKLQI